VVGGRGGGASVFVPSRLPLCFPLQIPNFTADTQLGPLNLHEYIDARWAFIFTMPSPFDPIHTTVRPRLPTLVCTDSLRRFRSWA
jgi:hypothetical protein